MKTSLCTVGLIWLLFSTGISAECGVGQDQDGRAIPSPVGNIPYLELPSSLCAGSGEYTWDYSGTLIDHEGKRISFQTSLAQLKRMSQNPSVGLGWSLSYIGFSRAENEFYTNNTYGSADSLITALGQSVGIVTSSSQLTQFSLQSTDSLGHRIWSISTDQMNPVPPTYLGYVGQPGHQYKMSGEGNTFLWKYDPSGRAYPGSAGYHYQILLTFVDERGGIMEGLGGGYFGPPLVNYNLPLSYNTEAEIGQPRLRVIQWSITLTSIEPPGPGYESTYQFTGRDGMLWNDYGPVLPVNPSPLPRAVPRLESLPPEYREVVSAAMARKQGPNGLYNGNWIPVCFTEGLYKGACLVTATFWTKYKKYPKDQSTDDLDWSNIGFQVLYTGVIPNRVASATTLLETLYPETPVPHVPADRDERPPYRVTLDAFVPERYGMAFPWVQEATVTVRARSRIREALASYANAYNPGKRPDSTKKDLVIKIRALSPVTQNTLFDPAVAQYYEGAAIPTINQREVGFSWLEHMVCPNIKADNSCQ